jgi:hypothetical protein
MRRLALTLLTAGACAAALAAGEREFRRVVRTSDLDVSAGLPSDLLEPEGKSRWHAASAPRSGSATRTSALNGTTVVIEESREAAPLAQVVYDDPSGGDAAARWVFPERFPALLQPGSSAMLRLEERRGDRVERLWIELAQVGIGWIHLPAGPREVVLQRARLFRAGRGGAGAVADQVLHRWVDPRAGVVAEVVGPAAAGGRERLAIGGARVVDEVLAGTSLMRLFVDDVDFAPRTRLNYGWAKQEVCVGGSSEGAACTEDGDCPGSGATCGAFVSSLTPEAHANIGALLAADSWDFSPSVAACTPSAIDCKEIVQGNVELSAAESCNADPNEPVPGTGITCGYQGAGRLLGRQDHDPGTPEWIPNNQVTERTESPTDATLWLRAGAQKEGVTGAFGVGETRFCYDPLAGKPPVALYRFPHQESGESYLQVGDAWSTSFSCNQVLYSTGLSNDAVCGQIGTFGLQRAAGTPSHAACTHPGTQSGQVLKEGVITLPSGHTLNAIVVRTVADFCVYNDCSCGTLFCQIVAEVRTSTLVWQVPHLGTVALLLSKQEVPDLTSYDKLATADIRVGHFPPVSITAGTVTDTSVALSWNPGNQTHRIDGTNGYTVYWDTVSGSATAGAYANSMTVSGTSATIGGLSPGTTYYFTVTSKSTYANPSNPGVATTYESLKYPTTVSGDPNFAYPVEVQATTACAAGYVPETPVTGLLMGKSGGAIDICWDPVHVADPCIEGYRILGAPTPEAPNNFSTVADVGLTQCWSGNPADGYFLVVTRASGGVGP